MNHEKFSGKTAELLKKAQEYVDAPEGVVHFVKEKQSEMMVKQHQKKAVKKMKVYGEDQLVPGIVFFLLSMALFQGTGQPIFACVSIAMAALATSGFFRRKKGKRMLKYWNILGQSKKFAIDKLAHLAVESKQTVYKDLNTMIELEVFLEVFLDRQKEILVLAEVDSYIQNYEALPNQQVVSLPQVSGSEEAQAFLNELREINLDIDNAKLTQQISHIEMLTGKIFEFQANNQDKERDLHSFLSYYLPTTLKILSSYAQLEDQNIEGENISKAKAQIEMMMDKVVEGFEKQLDQLFRTDTMDIASDISVLQQMFEKDGLVGDALKMESTPKDSNPGIKLKF